MTDKGVLPVEREALRWFLSELGSYTKSQPDVPAAGSPAHREESLPRAVSARRAYGIAVTLSELAAENASLFSDALDAPARVLACVSCARTVLENTSYARWLLEPEIEAAERVERVFGYRYRGLEQRVKISESDDAAVHRRRIEQLAQTATELNVTVRRHGSGRIRSVGAMRSATDLCKLYGGEETYRLLSAIQHGHGWAIRRWCYLPQGQTIEDGVPTIRFTKGIRPERLEFLIVTIVCGLSGAVWAMANFMGWDGDHLDDIGKEMIRVLHFEEWLTGAKNL